MGTDLSPKSVSLYDVPLSAPTILVLGNEGHGIRTNILRRCTHLVRIGEARRAPISSTPAKHIEGEFSDVTTVRSSNTAITSGDSTSGDECGYSESTNMVDEIENGVDDGAVDSLNVSVTGAIMLHHILSTTGDRK